MNEHEKRVETLLYCIFRYWYLEKQKETCGLGAVFEMFCVEQRHLYKAIEEASKDISDEIWANCRDEVKEISDRYGQYLWRC